MPRRSRQHIFSILRLCIALAALATLAPITTTAAGTAGAPLSTVTVTVDRSTPDGMSRLAVGTTHMQFSVDGWGDPDAVARGKQLLQQGVRYQNQHIHGFGVGPINEAPGTYDWSTLDGRVQLMRDTGAVPVITLCCSPTWMADPAWTGGTDWSKVEWAPLPEHEDAFADLARRVAERYPDVRHFMVWNEFKGMWSAERNNWDVERYTRLYNKVWDAVKAVRPDAAIGGPYLVVEGTGSRSLGQRADWYNADPVTDRNWYVLDYWLQHKRGADFVVLDKALKDAHDPAQYTPQDLLGLTRWFGDIVTRLKTRTSLPIWYAEHYSVWQGPDTPANVQQAGVASMLYHELKTGTSVVFQWEPQSQAGTTNGNNLFSDTRIAGGGQPFPTYQVYKLFNEHFGPGTQLVRASSSSPDVEVLASATHTLLINKQPLPATVMLNGTAVELHAFEVRVLS